MLMNDKEEYILNLTVVGGVFKDVSDGNYRLKVSLYDGTHWLHYESKKERDADHVRLAAAMGCTTQISQQQ